MEIPEGAPYVVVVEGDTLWDLAGEYLGSPYLWPQIWEENQYISDAHWIYPGDPLLLPRLQIVAEKAGELGPEGMPEEGEEGMPGMPAEYAPGEGAASLLFPVTEETSLLCAGYVVSQREDESLRITGSEQGSDQIAFAARDILYLNKGSNSGVRPGDVYSIHTVTRSVKNPVTGKRLGRKVRTQGTARVLLATEDSATVVVEQACNDIHVGDYLKAYEPPSVPLALRQEPPDRLTPPSGKAQGYVVDIAQGQQIAGAGHLLTVDMGPETGIAPGNLLVVFRTPEDAEDTRDVLGEAAVAAVHERTSLLKVLSSRKTIVLGDRVELR
jgi:hypothetical protein